MVRARAEAAARRPPHATDAQGREGCSLDSLCCTLLSTTALPGGSAASATVLTKQAQHSICGARADVPRGPCSKCSRTRCPKEGRFLFLRRVGVRLGRIRAASQHLRRICTYHEENVRTVTALMTLPMLNSARGPEAANATRALSSSPPRLLFQQNIGVQHDDRCRSGTRDQQRCDRGQEMEGGHSHTGRGGPQVSNIKFGPGVARDNAPGVGNVDRSTVARTVSSTLYIAHRDGRRAKTYGLALEYAKGLALGLGAERLASGLVAVARCTMRGARGGSPTASRWAFVQRCWSGPRSDLTRRGALRVGGMLSAEAGEGAARRQSVSSRTGRIARLRKRKSMAGREG